jgi:hypothetical protein
MNLETPRNRRGEMPKNLEVTTQGDTVIVRNHAAGAALTFRNGTVVASEGNADMLTKNNIASMRLSAAEAMKQPPTQQRAA